MTGKRKKSRAVHGRDGERDSSHDNPIIAALRRRLPRGCSSTLDLDRPPEGKLDLLTEFVFKDAIREIGFLVVKALLTGDRQIVRWLKDALKEANHVFRRDRELVLRGEVAKYLPDLYGLGIVAIKREIETRSNRGKKLEQHQWNRLRKAFSLAELPIGRPRNLGTKR
jgi:hypothetical protein